jgi:hypothetical protein
LHSSLYALNSFTPKHLPAPAPNAQHCQKIFKTCLNHLITKKRAWPHQLVVAVAAAAPSALAFFASLSSFAGVAFLFGAAFLAGAALGFGFSSPAAGFGFATAGFFALGAAAFLGFAVAAAVVAAVEDFVEARADRRVGAVVVAAFLGAITIMR